VQGLLNKQGAAVLGISEVTYQIHRSNIMRKMTSQSLAELVRMAIRFGFPTEGGESSSQRTTDMRADRFTYGLFLLTRAYRLGDAPTHRLNATLKALLES
jgi:hypothetical protein